MDRTVSLLVKFAALDKLTQPLKKIGMGSRGAAKDLAATTRELGALQRAQGKLDGMKALRAGLTDTYGSLDETRRRIRNVRLEIAATDNPSKRLTNSLAALERKEERLVSTTGQQSTKLEKLQGELRKAGIDATRFGDAEAKLASRLGRVNDKLSEQKRRMEQVAARHERSERAAAVGSKMRGVGAGATVAGVAIGAPLIAMAGDARGFGSIMTDVALKTELTKKETAAIGANLRRMGPDLAQLPTALAGGLDTLAGLGLDPRLGEKLMRPIGKAATGFKADVTDLSKVTFANFNNLKVPINQAQDALDAMATAGNKGGFELKDMATYFPTLTGRLQALKQKGVPAVADLSAALQIAFKTTGDASAAATNIENLLAKMNAKDTIENFSKFGIDLPKALKQAYAKGKTPLEAIAELTQKATGGNLDKLPFIFGDMQAQSGVLALIQNMEEYRKIRAAANAGGGTVDKTFSRRMSEDDQAKLDKFNAGIEKLKMGIGERLLPLLNNAMDRIGGIADAFDAWGQRNPGLANGLVILAAVVAALLVVFGALGIMAGALVSGWGIAAGVFSGIWTVLSLGGGIIMSVLGAIAGFLGLPVIAVAAIAAGLLAAGLLIYTYWDKIKAAFSAGIIWFVGLHVQFFNIGVQLIAGLGNGIASKFGEIKARIISLGKSAVGWFKNVLGIHSPSRVFQQLGGHMTNGLAIGIDRGAAGPLDRVRTLASSVAGTAATIAGAMMVGTAPVAAAGVSASAAPPAGTVHYHQHDYHISVQGGAGADARALAREIREEIKRLEQAERYSSMGDID